VLEPFANRAVSADVRARQCLDRVAEYRFDGLALCGIGGGFGKSSRLHGVSVGKKLHRFALSIMPDPLEALAY
jgi:hypothetical protein